MNQKVRDTPDTVGRAIVIDEGWHLAVRVDSPADRGKSLRRAAQSPRSKTSLAE